MDENPNLPPALPVPAANPASGRWVPQVILAVILAEAGWRLIVSLTNNLILPLLARVMATDAQSPLYLGKSDINVAALFASLLQFCVAAIVAALLNQWSHRGLGTVRVKKVRVVRTVVKPAQKPAPVAAAPPVTAAAPVASAPLSITSTPPSSPPAPTEPAPPVPAPAAVGAPAKPKKPTPPREIRYNSVGEPINPTEDDE